MDLLPGIASGLARVLVSYPVDYVRTLQQRNGCSLTDAWRASGGKTGLHLYRGSTSAFVSVPLERGIQMAVFEHFGAVPAALASTLVGAPLQAVVARKVTRAAGAALPPWRSLLTATAPEAMRGFIASTAYLSTYGRARAADAPAPLAGALAGMVAITVGYPLETLRIRLHVDGLKGMCRGGWWAGLPVAVARTVPSSAVGMTVYEFVRVRVQQQPARA